MEGNSSRGFESRPLRQKFVGALSDIVWEVHYNISRRYSMKEFSKRKPIVIPPRKVIPLKPRPIKCGACGMVFEIGKPICYSCLKPECPIFLRNYMA